MHARVDSKAALRWYPDDGVGCDASERGRVTPSPLRERARQALEAIVCGGGALPLMAGPLVTQEPEVTPRRIP